MVRATGVFIFSHCICDRLAGESVWSKRWGSWYKSQGETLPSDEDISADLVRLRAKFSMDGDVLNTSTPLQVRRVHVADLTLESFAELVRGGHPLVLVGLGDSWAMSSWTCAKVQKDFAKERVMVWGYSGDKTQLVKLQSDWPQKKMNFRVGKILFLGSSK